MAIDIKNLKDEQKAKLIDNRWDSSKETWDRVESIYKQNVKIYKNQAEWLSLIPYARQKFKVQANRVFVNMEAVINSLIANTPGINILPAREGIEAQEFARQLESYFRKKYTDLNVKEVVRMGLRNLYFGRLLVLKPFWNPAINDFDVRALDPRKVRFGKYARNERESEFVIEEISDNLCAVVHRFPDKKAELLKKYGITSEEDLYIKNPDVTYKEAWIENYVIFKLDNIILDTIDNPYWDWDGILITVEEEQQLAQANTEQRRQILSNAKLQQDQRKAQKVSMESAPVEPGTPEQQGEIENGSEEPSEYIEPTNGATTSIQEIPELKPYFFNYFDTPRKPYIFATIFNNENSPIGQTDMISLSADLQHGIDKRKRDIDENCELVNGWLKVDSSVMGKADAQRIRFETKGIVWGKGVKDGVTREMGNALPQMVFDDMLDSRQEIDNIMAASSAFRGERQGQETKAGRLALIQQSYLRLNELVQVVDYSTGELFAWFMQLAKTRYTESHYAKWMGKDDAQKTIEIIQDDFETGSEVTVIAGKTLPKDDEFKYEQAQNDVVSGFISPVDYLKIAQYDNASELAKNAVIYKQNPMEAVGISQQQMPVPFQPGNPTPDQIASITQPPQQPPQIAQPQVPTPLG